MFQSFIGLEVHIHLLTRSKVFCGCRAAFGDEPNSNVCPVCLGYPGVLPALNREAIRMGYLVARALGCTLSDRTLFERKNYFYPDLPKNYQISQFAAPLGRDGAVELELHKRHKRVRIKEVHLEEDAGKMIHAGDQSLLDFNRAGSPLLEIVTQPDLEVGEEAEVFLQNFRRLVRYLGVCDGNMEEGSLRCDANVSVNFSGKGLGDKVEIKNMNSFKFVRKALAYEIERQQEILERGGTVTQETRLWNENRDQTESMRRKEEAFDYRYFPEPDLPPFRPDADFLRQVEGALVELPRQRRERLMREHGLAEHQADFVTEERATADFFEQAVAHGAEPQAAAMWLAADVQKVLNRTGQSLAASHLSAGRFAELLTLLATKRIHGRIAKQVLDAVFAEDKAPLEIIRERGWEQLTDRQALESYVQQAVAAHPQAVKQIAEGDPKPLGFLVGEIMKLTSGRAEPGLVKEILNARLSLSFIQVLSMGGAISGERTGDGPIEAGDIGAVVQRLGRDPQLSSRLRFEEIEIRRILSEEITPEDWSALIGGLDAHLKKGSASGIVIAHGTDTLAYTASLLYWLFPRPALPVVITASLSAEGAEAQLRAAVTAASSREPGIAVCLGSRLLSPLNLKFERVAADGFRNWNMGRPRFRGSAEAPELPEERGELTRRLEEAINQAAILKVYPGMRGDFLLPLMDAGVRYFILELYDTGTASLRGSPYSLRKAFQEGKERGVRFFCTSQQEGIVDFSQYITSHELWREGAIPMGSLTTESAFTRLVTALLAGRRDEELVKAMEEANADLDG